MPSPPPPPRRRLPPGIQPTGLRPTRPKPPRAEAPGRSRRKPLAALPQLLMDTGTHLMEPNLRREDAERLAKEWAQAWFDLQEVRKWLHAGAGVGDGPGAAGLRDVGVPPAADCLPLFDDGTLRPGRLALVTRVRLGNITARDARASLERTGHLPSQPSETARAADV